MLIIIFSPIEHYSVKVFVPFIFNPFMFWFPTDYFPRKFFPFLFVFV
jgi:hypothetical protein